MSQSTDVALRPPAADVEILDSPETENPAVVYLRRLSAGSRGSMTSSMRQVLAAGGAPVGTDPLTFPWWRLTYVETSAVRSVLAERHAPATANRSLAALRGVLKEAWRLGLMSHEQMARACDLAPVRGSRLRAGRAVEAGEQRALFAVCAADTTPAGRRDAAVLALGLGGGLRRAEIAGLVDGDWDPDAGTVRVIGKGNKERSVPLTIGARRALEDWLAVRGPREPDERLIAAVRKDGLVLPGGISGQSILALLTRRATEAGIPALRPHDLRRTFVGDHLDGGTDLVVVQALAGHADVSTTASYDRRGDRARLAARENISTPYIAPVAAAS